MSLFMAFRVINKRSIAQPLSDVLTCGHYHRTPKAAAQCGWAQDRRAATARWGGRVCAVNRKARRLLSVEEYGAAFSVCNLGSWHKGKRGPLRDMTRKD